MFKSIGRGIPSVLLEIPHLAVRALHRIGHGHPSIAARASLEVPRHVKGLLQKGDAHGPVRAIHSKAAPFWSGPADLASFLERVRRQARDKTGEPPPPDQSDKPRLQIAYRPVFENLTALTTASLALTAMERLTLVKAYGALYEGSATLPLSVVSESGRLGRVVEQQRVRQAQAYVDAITPLLTDGAPLGQLDTGQKQTLVESVVTACARALGIHRDDIDVYVEAEPDPFLRGSQAFVMNMFVAPSMFVFPEGHETDPLTLLGLLAQETLHIHQAELSNAALESEEMLRSRDGGAPVEGPVVSPVVQAQGVLFGASMSRSSDDSPFFYPGRTDHERDGWLFQKVCKIVASHVPEIAASSPMAAFYAGISPDTLRREGPYLVLARRAERTGGFSLEAMARQIGVRHGDAAPPHEGGSPLAAWREALALVVGEHRGVAAVTLRSELVNEMLEALADVTRAAEEPAHPAHADARVLVAAVYQSAGFRGPFVLFKPDRCVDVQTACEECRRLAAKLTTPLARELLAELALQRLPQASAEQRGSIRKAAGLDA